VYFSTFILSSLATFPCTTIKVLKKIAKALKAPSETVVNNDYEGFTLA
jgi:hypothetical protein